MGGGKRTFEGRNEKAGATISKFNCLVPKARHLPLQCTGIVLWQKGPMPNRLLAQWQNADFRKFMTYRCDMASFAHTGWILTPELLVRKFLFVFCMFFLYLIKNLVFSLSVFR